VERWSNKSSFEYPLKPTLGSLNREGANSKPPAFSAGGIKVKELVTPRLVKLNFIQDYFLGAASG
jgi:hypothetical protein